jgi:hypothetical protein
MFSTLQQMFNLVKEEDMHGLFCVMGFMFGVDILDFEIKLFGHYFFSIWVQTLKQTRFLYPINLW